jgi:DhnA family fructose-bisphosphate aldolase class Ia
MGAADRHSYQPRADRLPESLNRVDDAHAVCYVRNRTLRSSLDAQLTAGRQSAGHAQVIVASTFTESLVVVTGPKALRMRRLFGSDGRLLLIAMDHAGFTGPAPGLDLDTMTAVVSAGADAVMTTYGTARRLTLQPQIVGRAALVISLNVNAVEPEEQVVNALRLGADSVKVLACSGERAQWTALHRYAVVCERWGLPFQAEVVPGGFDQPDQHTPHNIASVCRQAAEMGADYVKTLYTGDAESMRRVVDGATVPVIILGGERSSDEESLLRQVQEALAVGVAGVAFGRNVWSHPNPAVITARLAEVVHRSVGDRSPVDHTLAPPAIG